MGMGMRFAFVLSVNMTVLTLLIKAGFRPSSDCTTATLGFRVWLIAKIIGSDKLLWVFGLFFCLINERSASIFRGRKVIIRALYFLPTNLSEELEDLGHLELDLSALVVHFIEPLVRLFDVLFEFLVLLLHLS